MNQDEGTIRKLESMADALKGETVFQVGEEIEVNECLFEIIAIIPNPENILVLKGKVKTKL